MLLLTVIILLNVLCPCVVNALLIITGPETNKLLCKLTVFDVFNIPLITTLHDAFKILYILVCP